MPIETTSHRYHKQQLEEERQFVIAEFNGIRQFLEQQEHFLLLRVIENLEKGIMWEKAKHAAVLFREVSTFDELIQTVKEKCQQSAVELLQVVLGAHPLNLNQLYCNPVHIEDIPKRRTFSYMDLIVAPNVTLDPDTAHPRIILSEDLKSCWMGTKSQKLVQDNRRFDHMMCVLGRERFVTGRHYWEVAVENEGDWGVGVARSSVKRKGVKALCKMEGIWAMTKRYGSLWEYINPPALISEPIHWEIKKIRVSLNYHGGRVAFCDGERGNLLHAFSQLVEAEKKKVMDGFGLLRQLVIEQNTLWLSKVEGVKTEITLKTNDQMAVISRELFVLDYIIQDMVEKCDQPVLEFLEPRTVIDNLGHFGGMEV
ncbi:PREDICTED: E3 ubiquitin-protein ligase TRIM11-like [Thamnophis sirtalis]|uniref:E3 ubiquitin-protein ligase TRIM11-like n=1 Tax=Thamnophis sirtalis TaxID=35019 RepID=A0A6I9XP91_9SAUR|nr:PREDICTED: E3 ubiquitin-protein ligase TRIM11-like [Thamnophis sirtalis]